LICDIANAFGVPIGEVFECKAELHKLNEKIPASSNVVRESYDIPFYNSLMFRAQSADENIPNEFLRKIIEKLCYLLEVSQTLPAMNLPYTLCHNDIHGWNVITQGDGVVLLDWEGLRFAPREADLIDKFGVRWCIFV